MLATEPTTQRSRKLKYLQQQERRISALLDISYVTNRIVAASQPISDEEPTYRDLGRSTCEGESFTQSEQQRDASERDAGTYQELEDSVSSARQVSYSNFGEIGKSDFQSPNDNDDTSLSLQSDIRSRKTFNSSVRNGNNQRRNTPHSLAKFLNKKHGEGNYLLFSLCDDQADDSTLFHLRRQIVQLPWKLSRDNASELPTVPLLLNICYAFHAWLNMEDISNGNVGHSSLKRPQHVAVIYCPNGKTRTAIAIACYLKFTGQVDKTEDGFLLFLEKRCPDSELSPATVAKALPASIRTFFRNFDSTIELKRYMNQQPLLLRSIVMRGLPVEEKPCLNIFNAQGDHVYSSHPDLFGDISVTNPYAQQDRSQWEEEEGFFPVNQILDGDFYLLCRFGGHYAGDLSDPSKIIFRYANTTGFLGAGPIDLRCDRVDLMRRYAHLIDCKEFLFTMSFEASWNCSTQQEATLLQRDSISDNVPCVRSGYQAMEQGWEMISRHHSAKPSNIDVDLLHASCESLRECPYHLSALALQLSNFDLNGAENMLVEGKMRIWWSPRIATETPSHQYQTSSHAQPAIRREHLEIRNSILNVVRGVGSLSTSHGNGSFQTRATKQSTGDIEEGFTPLILSDAASWYTSPLMRPKSGDITNAIGNNKFIYPKPDHPSRRKDQPLIPLFPHPLPIKEGSSSVLDDPHNRNAFEMLMLSSSPTISMHDFLALQRYLRGESERLDSDSAQINGDSADIMQGREGTNDLNILPSELQNDDVVDEKGNAYYDENTVHTDAEDIHSSGPPLKDDECFTKYYKMLKMGLPRGAVENAMTRDGADLSLLDLDPEKSLASQRPTQTVSSASDPPLKDDECFTKYYKMLKMGLPRGAVENAMTRDGADLSLLDLDPEKSLASQRPTQTVSSASDPPLKDDECFTKYYKVLKMGLPRGAVENAMTRDGADLSLLDLDPEKSLASQRPTQTVSSASDPPLKDDICFTKYYKMLKMGLPRGAVENAMTRDGADLSLLDLDPEKSLASQRPTQTVSSASDPPLKDDECFTKYYKMLKMGLPRGAVENAMTRDGADLSLLDLDPEKSLASQRPTQTVSSASDPPLKDDECFTKYYKMLKMGLPRGAVENAMTRDGADLSLLDLDPEKSLASQRPTQTVSSASDPPLKDDECFTKYYKMLKMGLPRGAVENAMTRDGADLSLLDLDPEKSLASQRPTQTVSSASDPPLKDDECFTKYYKMLKMGLPRGAVENAMTRDGADLSLLDLDPEKSLASQRPTQTVSSASDPPLKDDECFTKYYKMLKMGLPRGAVENAMTRDGADLSLLDLDPEKSLASQRPTQTVSSASDPPLKDDECFTKYYKMLKMGLPRGAVENAMTRDGADLSLLDLDPEKSLASQRPTQTVSSASDPPLKDDECFTKYYKMLKMGLPRGAVENAMTRDGADLSLLDLDPEKSLASQRPTQTVSSASDPPLKDDECFTKYYKMLKMGLPRGAVENAMTRDGADLSLLDLDPEKSLASQRPTQTVSSASDPPLKDDECFTKYYKMLKMGLPRGAVENAMTRDGADLSLLDMDPDRSLISQLTSISNKDVGVQQDILDKAEFVQLKAQDMASQKGSSSRLPAEPRQNAAKKNVRRKKIFWNPINPGELREDSLWSLVKGKVQMDSLKYDVREFEDLFTESPDTAKAKMIKTEKRVETKKSVQVIDGKRSMNGGIILKRLRIEYKALAEMVESMEIGALDATSIKALKEYLPTVDERNQLQSYLKAAGDSKDIREKLYGDLSDCEKYMICMMDIAKADDHFDCMLFRVQFRSRFDELIDCLRTVDKACDEVRSSEKFRQIMAIILTVVNQINTGGEGKGQAMGFNLETLLKLNEAKAFDKKTSVLQYLIKVVKRNDESLIEFHKDLPHTNDSVNIILDSLCSDIKALKDDLEKVFKTSQEQADELLDLGITSKLSLSELKEQKTNVRSLSGVSQFNQVDHLTGRTPMERFCLHAKASIDEAYELTSQVQVKFRSLLQYFGEDEKMASNEFFGTLKRFISDFNNANQIVQKEEKMRLREMKRQESMKQTDRRISLEKQNKQVPESIEVVKSSPMSSASAISAFFAAKRGMDSDLKDRLPGSDAATGGVSLVDISSAVYSSSTLGGAQVPVGTDKDQGIDAEADKSEVCKLGKLSPHAAVAKSASSTSTKQSSLPGGDQTDTVVAAIGASNTKLPFVHCCDSLPAIMCTDKEKEKELSGASSVCEVSKDGGDDGDSKIPSA